MCKLCTIYCCLLENLSFEFEEGESNCIDLIQQLQNSYKYKMSWNNLRFIINIYVVNKV